MPQTTPPAAAPFTRAGLMTGLRASLPLWPSIAVFGAAFGAAAAQRGLTAGEAAATSALVYAGAAQMVTLEVWGRPWNLGLLLSAMTVTALINARMILMGATIQPWMRGAPVWRTALTLFVLVDASWLIGVRHRAEGGRDLGVLFGAGFGLWPLWVLSTVAGHFAGALVTQPRTWGLDMILPVFFAAMLAPLWRGAWPALPWLVSGVTALIVQRLVPGYGFIAAGAVAGLVTGLLLDDGAPR